MGKSWLVGTEKIKQKQDEHQLQTHSIFKMNNQMAESSTTTAIIYNNLLISFLSIISK